MKKSILPTLFCLYFLIPSASAQVLKNRLIGTWKLTALVNKAISKTEATKKYQFTDNRILYTSINKNFTADYTLDEPSGMLYFLIPGESTMRQLKLSIDCDTLRMTEGNITGLLVRGNP